MLIKVLSSFIKKVGNATYQTLTNSKDDNHNPEMGLIAPDVHDLEIELPEYSEINDKEYVEIKTSDEDD